MWSQPKRKRFQILRQHELDGTLAEPEQAELSQMNAEIESSVPLDAATERLREQRKQIEAQNRALDALVQRKQTLVNRLKAGLNCGVGTMQKRTDLHEAIAAYAAEYAGTPIDLDEELEAASVEHLLESALSGSPIRDS